MSGMEEVLGERILAHLFFFDETSLLLMIRTSEKEEKYYTFQDLISAIEKAREFADPREDVLRALDTLLDSGIYKPEWRLRNGCWERVFFNRSEIAEVFTEDKDRILEPIDPLNPWKSDEVVMNIFMKIFMREAGDLSSKLPCAKRISNVKSSLLQFIKERLLPELKKYKHNLVLLPTMRKGYTIFKHLCEEVDLNGIEIEYSGFLNKERFNGKKVLLLDDAVEKGNVLYGYYCKLKDIGVDENNILMATYLMNNNAVESEIFRKHIKNRLIVEPMKKLSDEDFHKEVSDILMYIASLCEIIDPDHLLIKIRFVNSLLPENVMEILESLRIGQIFEPNFDYLHPNKKKITLSFNTEEYKELTHQTLPNHIKGIDICKIRFIFDLYKENDIYKAQISSIVPIVLPKISEVMSEEERNILQKYHFDRWKDGKTLDTPPYVDATVYGMTTLFVKGFFKRLQNKEVELAPYVEVDWEYFKSKYEGFNDLLGNFQDELLEQYWH